MRRLSVRLMVALLTFGMGVVVADFWFAYRLPAVETLGLPLCAGPPYYETASDPCSGTNFSALSGLPIIPYCDLVRNFSNYENQIIRVKGIYYFNMENSALGDPACRSQNTWTWIETEPYSNFGLSSKHLKRNQFAQVVFLGRFFGPDEQGYGHLNDYRFRLLVMRVEEMQPLPPYAR